MRISLAGLVIGLGFAVMAAAARAPLSTRGVPLDRIVAVVNDGVVLESELEVATAEVRTRLKSQNVSLPAEAVLRSQVLERLGCDLVTGPAIGPAMTRADADRMVGRRRTAPPTAPPPTV